MNCASAGVIMQLLSPQDWLDGIQAALLVITIFLMFATLFVTPSKIYILLELCHNSMELSQCDSLKRVKTETLGTLFISAHLEKWYPTLVIKFPESELKYGKIWSMSPNSDLHHLKAHFFTASFVWRFRFVIFIAWRPSTVPSPPTLSSKTRKRQILFVVVGCQMSTWKLQMDTVLKWTSTSLRFWVFCLDDLILEICTSLYVHFFVTTLWPNLTVW